VKTAISIPDDTFAKVTSTARALGLSRSEFMTRAAVAYLSELELDSLKAEIDAAAELLNGGEDTMAFVAASTRRLREQSDEW